MGHTETAVDLRMYAQTIYYQENLAFCLLSAMQSRAFRWFSANPLVSLFLGFLPLQLYLIWGRFCVLYCISLDVFPIFKLLKMTRHRQYSFAQLNFKLLGFPLPLARMHICKIYMVLISDVKSSKKTKEKKSPTQESLVF
jgi:hypothetical protein